RVVLVLRVDGPARRRAPHERGGHVRRGSVRGHRARRAFVERLALRSRRVVARLGGRGHDAALHRRLRAGRVRGRRFPAARRGLLRRRAGWRRARGRGPRVREPRRRLSPALKRAPRAAPPAMDDGTLAFLLRAEALKDQPRRGWRRALVARPESVADHAWGVALLATLACPEGVSRARAVELAILHDVCEAVVGDLVPGEYASREEKLARERAGLLAMLE